MHYSQNCNKIVPALLYTQMLDCAFTEALNLRVKEVLHGSGARPDSVGRVFRGRIRPGGLRLFKFHRIIACLALVFFGGVTALDCADRRGGVGAEFFSCVRPFWHRAAPEPKGKLGRC